VRRTGWAGAGGRPDLAAADGGRQSGGAWAGLPRLERWRVQPWPRPGRTWRASDRHHGFPGSRRPEA